MFWYRCDHGGSNQCQKAPTPPSWFTGRSLSMKQESMDSLLFRSDLMWKKLSPKRRLTWWPRQQKVLWRHKGNFKSFLQTALSPCKGLFSESKHFNLARNKWQRIKKNNPLELLCPRQSRRADRVKVLHVIPTESSNEKRSFDSDYLYLRCEARLWDKLRMTFSWIELLK